MFEWQEQYVVVGLNFYNLHEKPDINSRILKQLKMADHLRAAGGTRVNHTSPDGRYWHMIYHDGMTGWMEWVEGAFSDYAEVRYNRRAAIRNAIRRLTERINELTSELYRYSELDN